MLCGRCGTILGDNEVFCSRCGYRNSAGNNPAGQNQKNYHNGTGSAVNGYPGDGNAMNELICSWEIAVTDINKNATKSSNGKKVIIIIICVPAFILITIGSILGGVALYNAVNGKDKGVGEKVEFGGHSYAIIQDPAVTTYEVAKEYCIEKGGHLATITSREENDFLYNHFYNNCDYPSAFLGYELKDNTWVTGEKMAFDNINEKYRESQLYRIQQLVFSRNHTDGTWAVGEFDNHFYTNKAVIASANATSVLHEENITHNAGKIFDENTDTAWVEGEDGFGIGESITLNFDKAYTIDEMEIAVGYQRSSELFRKNSRPCDLKLTFSDGSTQMVVLKDNMGYQNIEFESVRTDSVKITIVSAYRGETFEDTAICEVLFYCSNTTPAFICEWE